MKPMTIFLMAIAMLTTEACQSVDEPRMNIEEAREIVLSMQQIPMDPPSRRMDDILSLLEERDDPDPAYVLALKRQADMSDPVGQHSQDLYHFYKMRGYARFELNRFNACRKDLSKAIENGRKTGISDTALLYRLSEVEMRAGRYQSAMALAKSAMSSLGYRGRRVGPYQAYIGRIHLRMGNLMRARFSIRSGRNTYIQIPKSSRITMAVEAPKMDMPTEADVIVAEAELLEAQGQFTSAHPLRSAALNFNYRTRRHKPSGVINAWMALADNLRHQDRLVEADKEARLALKEAMDVFGKNAPVTAEAARTLGEVALAKGDLASASTLATTQVAILEDLSMPADEEIAIRGWRFKAVVESAAFDFKTAMKAYDAALAGMRNNPYLFRRLALMDPGLILSLIKTGRLHDADEMLSKTSAITSRLREANNDDNYEIDVMAAMIEYAKTGSEKAIVRISETIPLIKDRIQDPNSGFVERRHAESLIRSYIDLLIEQKEKGASEVSGISISEEILKLADYERSRVSTALSQSSARAAALTDERLADLVRQEQDADNKIQSLKTIFYNAVAASLDAEETSLDKLNASIQKLTAARQAILQRIAVDFPAYANFIKPSSPGIGEIQAALRPSETFITIWTMTERTCIWAVPAKGEALFAVVQVGLTRIDEMVKTLRRALNPNVRQLNRIPDYSLKTAHELYRLLLEPVEKTWRASEDLLVVIKGPADQIPLAILPTEQKRSKGNSRILFDSYRSLPWLIKSVSITRLPSAASLITLRRLPAPATDREPFAGFGDPIFSSRQHGFHDHGRDITTRGKTGTIHIRGIRTSSIGKLDDRQVASTTIEDLSRLPDTADEIEKIAESLGANPKGNSYLQTAATESNVKSIDIANKRVIAFATHALIPGDLDGLTQPALAFTSPEVVKTEDGDGLLTAGEILTLKLDADLVVLSACDSGAGDGRGSEAVSGLGRAFFYSGARALLVTMWPVETTSANRLTTGMFKTRKQNPNLTWAQAQRNSILALIDDPGLKGPDGRVAARYAHPIFWGPFLLVGDSGVREGLE
jgi:CHAT domain-containing protein